MSKINVKGLNIYLTKKGSTPLALVPTAITKAKPAVVTVASVTGVVKGDVIDMGQVGFTELNGKTFVAGAIDGTANTIELLGSDTTGSSGTLNASPTMSVHKAADQVKLCLSSIEIAAPSVNQIDTSTFCGESSINGKATPGALTLGGYLDKDDLGLAELILADEDGAERVFELVFPGDNGYLVGKIAFSGLSMSIPLEGAVQFTITGSQQSRIRWVH